MLPPGTRKRQLIYPNSARVSSLGELFYANLKFVCMDCVYPSGASYTPLFSPNPDIRDVAEKAGHGQTLHVCHLEHQ